MMHTLRMLPRGVWSLGFVSLFMDISSEMIHSLLPVFLVTVLGVSTVTLGVIEGVAEAAAAIVKVFSGAVSDWLGRRKPLLLFGYGLAACTKPLFALASGAGLVFTARFVDRIGKGIRGAPRDALIADYTPTALRGAAYGLRQSMDTMGAFIGPLVALLLMAASGGNFRAVFWAAVVPAFICLGVILVGVREPPVQEAARVRRSPLSRRELLKLPPRYWYIVAFAAVLTLARFSEAFLLLRAANLQLAVTWIPLILMVMNVAYAGSAYPLGYLSDRIPRRRLLGLGIVLLILADVVLGLANGAAWVAIGAVLWGLHMGATQGLLSALVADGTPAELRGTAFGIFHLISGIVLLFASVVAGWLWSAVGPAATFYAGAVFALVALAGLLTAGKQRRRA
jgi:MFS family permease